MIKINEIHKKIAAIVCRIGGEKPDLGGTGFFYAFANQTYLITNKHVVEGFLKKQISKEISVRTFLKLPSPQFWKNPKMTWTINLFTEDNQKRWSEFGENVDLVAIPCEVPNECFVMKLNQQHLPSENLIFTANNNVFIPSFGLLHNFLKHKEINNYELPTYKGGTVASCLVEPLSNMESFLIDLEGIPENSGSPVLFFEPEGSGIYNLRLLGIVSSVFPNIRTGKGQLAANTTVAIGSSFLKQISVNQN